MSTDVMPETLPQQQPPKSKTGCILLGIGGGCLIAILACGGLGGLGIVGLFAAIKSSEPYTESLQRAQASDEVGSKIGQPVEPDFIVSGHINLDNNHGEADLNYSITGPDGTASVDVAGTKNDGVWNYGKMNVTTSDGTVIDLLDAAQ
jgi:hypothetical protein